MNTPTYDKNISAVLVVDPYNDFISEGGKIWPRIKAVAEANDCVSNMLKVLNAARAVKLRVFYAMHHRYRAGVPNSRRRQVRLSRRNTGAAAKKEAAIGSLLVKIPHVTARSFVEQLAPAPTAGHLVL